MKITMDMSNYEIEHKTTAAECRDDILCAGWNPEIDSVRQQLQLAPTTEQMAMPAALTTKVAELFLRKIYSNYNKAPQLNRTQLIKGENNAYKAH